MSLSPRLHRSSRTREIAARSRMALLAIKERLTRVGAKPKKDMARRNDLRLSTVRSAPGRAVQRRRMTGRGDPPSKLFSSIERHAAAGTRAEEPRRDRTASAGSELAHDRRAAKAPEKGMPSSAMTTSTRKGPNWTISAFIAGSASGYM